MTDPNPNFTPSQEHNACSNARTLGHDFPQFVARFGAPHAIQRAKAELRRGNAPDPENSIPSGAKSSLISIPTQRTIRTPRK